mmetsp:Transcript_29930/g.28811  ORF Transcript_29930/g.28811 Transcript_29930/m.28811 type:complete len:229 (-) Transcript_29930:9-695(-)
MSSSIVMSTNKGIIPSSSTTVISVLILIFCTGPTFCLQQSVLLKNNRLKHSTSLVRRDVEPVVIGAAAAFIVGGVASGLWLSGSEERAQKSKYAEIEAKYEAEQLERERLAYIEPRDGGKGLWSLEEIAPYDGSDPSGPLLFAANGDVFNVWKGRHFYGPGCEYNVFAGTDATRLLAKSKLEEETPEEASVPLNIAQRAALAGWIYTFKGKYDIVGQLNGYNPKDSEL